MPWKDDFKRDFLIRITVYLNNCKNSFSRSQKIYSCCWSLAKSRVCWVVGIVLLVGCSRDEEEQIFSLLLFIRIQAKEGNEIKWALHARPYKIPSAIQHKQAHILPCMIQWTVLWLAMYCTEYKRTEIKLETVSFKTELQNFVNNIDLKETRRNQGPSGNCDAG